MKNISLQITDKQSQKAKAIKKLTSVELNAIYSSAFAVGLEIVAKEAKDAK